jgi:hypothetical protein
MMPVLALSTKHRRAVDMVAGVRGPQFAHFHMNAKFLRQSATAGIKAKMLDFISRGGPLGGLQGQR